MAFTEPRPSSQRVTRVIVRLVAVASGLCAVAATSDAHALPLLTLSGSLRGLYGSVEGDPELNPYGGGLGLRAGVTLPASIYLGGSLDYFFGDSGSVAGIETSASVLQIQGNVGYDFGLGPLTLRPFLGFGFAQNNVDIGDEDVSEGDFALSPGVEAIVGLGLLSVGAELRYNKIYSDEDLEADAVIVGIGLGISL